MRIDGYLLKNHFSTDRFIREALAEDIGDGDHTSLSTIPANKQGRAKLLVKENGVIAGLDLARDIFRKADKKLRLKFFVRDGDRVKKGDIAFIVEGSARSIVTAERVVLNCMQRMSGIATMAKRMQEKCKGTKAKVLDTRKTTPGLRGLEKLSVVIGGAYNHRFGLYDMILIKDNHVDYAGGVEPAIRKAQDYLKKKKKKLKIEIEVRSMKELKEAMSTGGIHRILFDNFSLSQLRTAVKLVNGSIETEASGGITEKNIVAYARCGVDYISTGALTHSVKSLDLSLKAIS